MEKSNRSTIFIALFLLLSLGLGYYLYTLISIAGDRWPLFEEPGSLTADIKSLTRQIGELKKEEATIPEVKQKLEDLKKEYEVALRVLPTESTQDQLIGAIRLMTQQSKVTLDRINPMPSRASVAAGGKGAPKLFDSWTASLELHGSYDQLATFVNKLEQFESSDPATGNAQRRFFQVTDIDITSEDGGLAELGDKGYNNEKKGHACKMVIQTFRYVGGNKQ